MKVYPLPGGSYIQKQELKTTLFVACIICPMKGHKIETI